jgi:hypothetical protein
MNRGSTVPQFLGHGVQYLDVLDGVKRTAVTWSVLTKDSNMTVEWTRRMESVVSPYHLCFLGN